MACGQIETFDGSKDASQQPLYCDKVEQEAQLLLGDRATRKHAKDS